MEEATKTIHHETIEFNQRNDLPFIHTLLYFKVSIPNKSSSTAPSSFPSLIYPNNNLSNELIEEIKFHCFSTKLKEYQNSSYQYVVKLSNPNDAYCFISLKQNIVSSKKKKVLTEEMLKEQDMFQQAYVLVSPYPIPYLAYRVLNILESSQMTRMARLESRSSHTTPSPELYQNELLDLFARGYNEMINWPSLKLSPMTDDNFGLDVMLPFFEQNLYYKVVIPSAISGIDLNTIHAPTASAGVPIQPELSHTLISLGSSMLFSGKSSLISILGPCGFIPHLWTIWELLVQGADIIVCGKDPQSVCELVLALSTLVITPLELFGSRGHLVRPLVSRGGPTGDVQEIIAAVKRRKENALSGVDYTAHMEGSYIVGITDPTLLLDFKDFTALVAIPERSQFNQATRIVDEMAVESLSYFNPKFIAPMRYFTKEDMNLDGSKEIVYSSSRLMYEDIRSSLKSGDETKEDSKKQDDSSGTMPLSSKSNPQKLAPSFFSRTYVSWTLLNEKMSVYTPGLVVFPYLPHVSPIQEGVYKKLISLPDTDYVTQGDQILREHFNRLTASFFRTLLDNEQTNLSTKSITFSLIQSIGDRLIPPYDLTSKPITIFCQSFDLAFGTCHWNLKAIDRNGAEHVWEVTNIGRALSKVEPLVVEKLPIGVKTTQRSFSGRVITIANEEIPTNGIVVDKSIEELDAFIQNYAKGKNFHMIESNAWNCQRFTAETMWWASNSLENIPKPKINQDPANMALDPWGNEKPNRGVKNSQCAIN